MRKALATALLLLAGCTTPTLIDSINVVLFDKTPRPPSTKVELLRSRPGNAKVFGMMTLSGQPEAEAKVTAAFLERAQQLGADAIVMAAGGNLSMLLGDRVEFANWTKDFAKGVQSGAENAKQHSDLTRMRAIVFKADLLIISKQD